MSLRIETIFSLIVLILLSCKTEEATQNVVVMENQNDHWVEIELQKQLSKTDLTDSIEIYGLPIEDLPQQIYQVENLRYLRIDCNSFSCMKSLSSNISKFSNLETLIITKSALTTLPKEIGKLGNLKKLIVAGGGQLGSVPTELSNLDKLEELDLWRNSLTELAVDLNDLGNLKTVYLGENNFSKKYIDGLIEQFPKIKIKMNYVKD